LTGPIPADLFSANAQAANLEKTFESCGELTDIPVNLLANNGQVMNLNLTFAQVGVTSATVLPDLWNSHPAAAHNGTFRGCNAASNWASVPDAWR
jgi:hypothetical protein